MAIDIRGMAVRETPFTLNDIGSDRLGGVVSDFERMLAENPVEAFDRAGALSESQGTRLTDYFTAYTQKGRASPENVRQALEERNPKVPFEEARTRIADAGLSEHLKIPKDGMRKETLDLLMEWKNEELIREQKRAAAPDDWAQLGLGVLAGISASVLDPINITLGLLPLGPTRLLAAATRVGRAARVGAAGAVTGGATAAALEPFIYSSMQEQQANYTLDDSINNILFSAAFGGVFGAVGGAISRQADVAAPAPRPSYLDNLNATRRANGDPLTPVPFEIHRAAATQAVEAVAEGRPVRGAEVLAKAAETDPRVAAALDDHLNPAGAVIENVGRVSDNSPDAAGGSADVGAVAPSSEAVAPQVEALAAEVKRLRGMADKKTDTIAPPAMESLNNFINQRGGLNLDDLDVGNIRDATGNKKQAPGFYRRQGGQKADRMREAAAEAGYFGAGRDPQDVSMDEFMDAIVKESNGRRVFIPERAAEFQADQAQYDNIMEAIGRSSLKSDASDLEVAQMLFEQDAQHKSMVESAARSVEAADDVPEWFDQEAVQLSKAMEDVPDYREESVFDSMRDEFMAEQMRRYEALVKAGDIDSAEARAFEAQIDAMEAEAVKMQDGYDSAIVCMGRSVL